MNKPTSVRTRLFNSSASKFIETVVNVVSGFLIMPFMIENLGTDNYGMWILILSIMGWFSILTAGLPAAVQRSLSMHIATNDVEGVNKTFSCGLVLFTSLGAVAATSLLILGFNAGIFDVLNEKVFANAMMILSIKIFWDFSMKAFYGFFSATLRFDIDCNLTSIGEIIKSVLIVLLIKHINIYGVVAAVIITDIFVHGMQVYYTRKLFPQMSFKLQYVSMEEVKKLFNVSKHLIASSLARVIYTQSDPIIVSKLFGLQAVALFSIPARLCAHIASFTQSVMSVFFPLFSAKHAKNDDVREFFKSVITINLFVCCLFSLPLLVMCNTFILLWVGEEFVVGYPIVFFLSFTLLCSSVSGPVQDLLLSQANHRLFTVVNLLGAVSNIVLSLLFSQIFGLVGVAMGTAVSYLIVDVTFYLYLLKRYNDIAIFPIYRQFAFATLTLFGLGIALNYAVTRLELGTWLELILMSGVVALFSMIVTWFLLLNKQLRAMIGGLAISQIKGIFSRRKIHSPS